MLTGLLLGLGFGGATALVAVLKRRRNKRARMAGEVIGAIEDAAMPIVEDMAKRGKR